MITDQDSGPYWIALDMDEFYDRNPFLGFEYRGVRRIGLTDVVLTGVSEEQAQRVRPGEKVALSGTIKDLKSFSQDKVAADPANGRLTLLLEQGSTRSLSPTPLEGGHPIDAKAAIITWTRPVCGMSSTKCYIYELIVRGSGSAVYSEYDWDSIDEGKPTITKTFSVTDEVVPHLVSAFEKADCFSMKDDYEAHYVSDAGSSTTSFSTLYYRKSVFHYGGDHSAPNALHALERELDDLATANKP